MHQLSVGWLAAHILSLDCAIVAAAIFRAIAIRFAFYYGPEIRLLLLLR
jgi:hypothetical protein